MDRQNLYLKQRINIEEQNNWSEKICYDTTDRKRIKDVHLRFGHASKKNSFFLKDSGMQNNLKIKDIEEVIENVNANCTACNETGKVANIRNLLTPSINISMTRWRLT